jgi:hypothetical protein
LSTINKVNKINKYINAIFHSDQLFADLFLVLGVCCCVAGLHTVAAVAVARELTELPFKPFHKRLHGRFIQCVIVFILLAFLFLPILY